MHLAANRFTCAMPAGSAAGAAAQSQRTAGNPYWVDLVSMAGPAALISPMTELIGPYADVRHASGKLLTGRG
jgi:hypothetical protein